MENEKKKSLQVNCAVCDARRVREETLAAYERVQINGATLVTDERSQDLLSKYAVGCNCAAVNRLESGEVRLRVSNGSEELRPHAAPADPTYLVCNGRITVFPGAEDTLAGYVGITVNGTILCPESLSTRLPNVIVNGSMHTYPDDCILLKSTQVLERTFVLRAKQGARYFAAGRVVALAPDTGVEKLVEKGVQFVTRRAIVAEGLVEAAMPLFDEREDVVIVPDGCAFVDDDATLDRSLLRRYGDKLYVNGDLEVAESAGEVLSEVKYLKVNGDVTVPAALEERFHAIRAEYDGLIVLTGEPEQEDEEEDAEPEDPDRVVINTASYQL